MCLSVTIAMFRNNLKISRLSVLIAISRSKIYGDKIMLNNLRFC